MESWGVYRCVPVGVPVYFPFEWVTRARAEGPLLTPFEPRHHSALILL